MDPFFNHPQYQYVRELGAGAFGRVVLARNNDTKTYCAVKLLPRGYTIDDHVEQELLNHRLLEHPHIVRLDEVFLTNRYLCLVLEYADKGNLLNFIRERSKLTEGEARWVLQQTISALDYLHRRGVAHRDVKAENIVVMTAPKTSKLRHMFVVKICDLGFSKATEQDMSSLLGSAAYMAPEVAEGETAYDGVKADIWSAGVLLYTMLMGEYPFKPGGLTINQEQYKAGLNLPASRISESARRLLTGMLVVDPSKRCSIADILENPWFQQDLPSDIKEDNNHCLAKVVPAQELRDHAEDLTAILKLARVAPKDYGARVPYQPLSTPRGKECARKAKYALETTPIVPLEAPPLKHKVRNEREAEQRQPGHDGGSNVSSPRAFEGMTPGANVHGDHKMKPDTPKVPEETPRHSVGQTVNDCGVSDVRFGMLRANAFDEAETTEASFEECVSDLDAEAAEDKTGITPAKLGGQQALQGPPTPQSESPTRNDARVNTTQESNKQPGNPSTSNNGTENVPSSPGDVAQRTGGKPPTGRQQHRGAERHEQSASLGQQGTENAAGAGLHTQPGATAGHTSAPRKTAYAEGASSSRTTADDHASHFVPSGSGSASSSAAGNSDPYSVDVFPLPALPADATLVQLLKANVQDGLASTCTALQQSWSITAHASRNVTAQVSHQLSTALQRSATVLPHKQGAPKAKPVERSQLSLEGSRKALVPVVEGIQDIAAGAWEVVHTGAAGALSGLRKQPARKAAVQAEEGTNDSQNAAEVSAVVVQKELIKQTAVAGESQDDPAHIQGQGKRLHGNAGQLLLGAGLLKGMAWGKGKSDGQQQGVPKAVPAGSWWPWGHNEAADAAVQDSTT